MPKPIGEVINQLALKAGIAIDNEDLKALLSAPELANVNVPDELVSTIDKNLLSLEAAKNNHPDIKKVYTSAVYDGMDKLLLKLIGTDTFDQADFDEIKNEPNTARKQELIISKLKAAKSSAKGADKDVINEQLKQAHEAARLAKEEVSNVKKDYEGKIKNMYKDAAIKAAFSNYKTIYDDLGEGIKSTSLKAIIDKALQDKNADLNVDENGNLQLISKDGSNVFGSNHIQLTPQSFLDQSLAPILKVSAPPKAASTPRPQPNTIPTTGGAGEANTGFLKSHADQVLQDMSAPRVGMM